MCSCGAIPGFFGIAQENVEVFLNEAERFQALQLVQYCDSAVDRVVKRWWFMKVTRPGKLT